jgi:RES domain-containing protein
MKYFRLMEDHPDKTPLGYGRAGARWNFTGVPLIYACNHVSLSYLELFSIKGPAVANLNWILVTLEVLGDIPHLDPQGLPSDWKMRHYPISTQQIGSQWAQKMISPYLKVPSCRIAISSYPEEHNLLINPIHPDFGRLIKFIGSEPVSYELNR